MRVGIIGCGNISDVYVRTTKLFNDIEIIACSDIIPAAAQGLAHKYSLREMNVGALLNADDIEIIQSHSSHSPRGSFASCDRCWKTRL